MLNEATIIGRLGADPEIRTFPNGGKVCNLRVATSEKWTDRNTGEKREETEWHSVVIHNDGLIRVAERWLRKGALVYIQGKSKTRKWQDQSGQDRYSHEISLRGFDAKLIMLDVKRQDDRQEQGSYGSAPPDIDDDLPF